MIETMQAGRDLDVMIAEEVMGWAGIQRGVLGTNEGVPIPHGFDPSTRGYGSVPYYSRDIAAAWLVVEKCGLSVVQSVDGWYAVKPYDIEHGDVPGTGARHRPAETPALAICRAALAAIGSRSAAQTETGGP